MKNCAYVGANATLRYVGNDGNVTVSEGSKGTISLWFREHTQIYEHTDDRFTVLTLWSGTDNYYVRIARFRWHLEYVWRTAGQVSGGMIESSGDLTWPGRWHHVALTWDTSGGGGYPYNGGHLYWNGTKLGPLDIVDSFSGGEPAYVDLGCRGDAEQLCAAVANVAIWDDVMDESQVLGLCDMGRLHVPQEVDGEGNLLFRTTFRDAWDADIAAGTGTAVHTVDSIEQDEHMSLARLDYRGDDAHSQVRAEIGSGQGREPITWHTNVEAINRKLPGTPIAISHEEDHAVLTYPVGFPGEDPLGNTNRMHILHPTVQPPWLCRAGVWIDGHIDDDANYWTVLGLRAHANRVDHYSSELGAPWTVLDLVTSGAADPESTGFAPRMGTSYPMRDVQVIHQIWDSGYVIFNGFPRSLGEFGNVSPGEVPRRFIQPHTDLTQETVVRISHIEAFAEQPYYRATRCACSFMPVVSTLRGWAHEWRDPWEWEALNTEIALHKPTWASITWPGAAPYGVLFGWADEDGWHGVTADDTGALDHYSLLRYDSADEGATWVEHTGNGFPLDTSALVEGLQSGNRPFGTRFPPHVEEWSVRLMPVFRLDGGMTLRDGTTTLAGNARFQALDSDAVFSITGLGQDFSAEAARGPFDLLSCHHGVACSEQNAEALDTACLFLWNPHARHEGERLVSYPAQLKFSTEWAEWDDRQMVFLFGGEPLTSVHGARSPWPHGTRNWAHAVRMTIWKPGWLAPISQHSSGASKRYLYLDVSSDGTLLSRVGDIVHTSDLPGTPSHVLKPLAIFEDGDYHRLIISDSEMECWVGTIGRDRWTACQLRAGEVEGYTRTCLISQPLEGWSRLLVNFDPGATGGRLDVAVLDANTGQEIPGYGRADCDGVTTDSLSYETTWDGEDLSSLSAHADLAFVFWLSRAAVELETPKLYVWEHVTETVGGGTCRDPRVEGEEEPSDVHAPAPEFTWTYEHPEDGPQAAYRVVVSSTADALGSGSYDMWDSGWVVSTESEATYGGDELASGEIYHYLIWSRTAAGAESDPAQGTFGMGVLPGVSYCTVDDVWELLTCFDLSTLGEESDIRATIDGLLATTKAQTDSVAGRDFGVHSHEIAVTDGAGHDCLFLFRLGYRPLISVNEMLVDDGAVPPGDYAVYSEQGYIRLKPTASWGTQFPKGVANVEIDLDWGYATPPAEVVAAQAMLTAAQLVARVSSAGSGGTVSRRLGEYAVTYAEEGPYAAGINRWLDDVAAALAPYRAMGVNIV